MQSDGTLTEGSSGRRRPAARRTNGSVDDDSGWMSGSPRQRAPERSETTNPSAGGRQLVVEGLLAALLPSSLGLVGYAILRGAYVWFYQRYGVAPEEVGLNQLRVLSSMFRFVHLWVWTIPGSPGTNVLVLLLLAAAMAGLWRRLLPRLRRRSRYVDSMAGRHPVLLGTSVAMLLIILSFSWALPRDRSFAGQRIQLGRAVRPAELAVLSIQADPARLTWIGPGRPPGELLGAKLIYLGKADGVLVLYQPPNWPSCETDSCRGATWKVHERDVVLHLEVNPPDRDAPAQRLRRTHDQVDRQVVPPPR